MSYYSQHTIYLNLPWKRKQDRLTQQILDIYCQYLHSDIHYSKREQEIYQPKYETNMKQNFSANKVSAII